MSNGWKEVILEELVIPSVKFIGDNVVLIQGYDESEVGKLIEDNKEWWESNFEYISPWSSSLVLHHKKVWVRCWDLPFNLWSKKCFGKVIATLGTLESIDEKTIA